MRLDPDFSEFIELLLANDVSFMVVGGYAVAAHGHPRYTDDLDLWILVERDNAEKLIRALQDFGFGSHPRISSWRSRSFSLGANPSGSTS